MKKWLVVLALMSGSIRQVKAQWGADVILFFIQAAGTCDEIGYEYKQTYFGNKFATLHSVKFGWHAGDQLSLGFSANFGSNRITPWNSNDLHILDYASGHIYGEYHFRNEAKEKFFNWSASLHTGRGFGSLRGSNLPLNFQNESSFWVFEPGGNFNLYLLRVIRLNVGVSYRIITGSRLYGQTDWTLSGPCLNAGISFNRWR